MPSPTSIDPAQLSQVLPLFEKVAAEGFIERLRAEHNLNFRNGIYTLSAVVWLMMFQRLHAKGTLASAVQSVVQGEASRLHRAKPSKRVRDGKISSGSSGYCQARQNLPTW